MNTNKVFCLLFSICLREKQRVYSCDRQFLIVIDVALAAKIGNRSTNGIIFGVPYDFESIWFEKNYYSDTQSRSQNEYAI